MKKPLLFLTLFMGVTFFLNAQSTISLTFTGQKQDHTWLKLSMVEVENLTRNWCDTLYYPDTVYYVGSVGVHSPAQTSGVQLLPNMPNPFEGTTEFVLQLLKLQPVVLEIYDLNGKPVTRWHAQLPPGQHRFRASLGTPQTYLLKATTPDGTAHIKMVNVGKGSDNTIEYVGENLSMTLPLDDKGACPYPFSLNDSMRYVGYVYLAGNFFGEYHASNPIVQQQTGNETLTFTIPIPVQRVTTLNATSVGTTSAVFNGNCYGNENYILEKGFYYGIDSNALLSQVTSSTYYDEEFNAACYDLLPNSRYYYRAYLNTISGTILGAVKYFDTEDTLACPTSVVDYDGNVYNTVLIGSQCWMKENLKTTHYSNGTFVEMGTVASPDEPSRFFPNNDSTRVGSYGYLYNWRGALGTETESFANPSGVQGICPAGWHLPSSGEWNDLVAFVSVYPAYQCQTEQYSVGKALASTTGWAQSPYSGEVGCAPSTNNATGFSALPAGYGGVSNYGNFGEVADFWSSSRYYQCGLPASMYFELSYQSLYLDNHQCIGYEGYSVRCVYNR